MQEIKRERERKRGRVSTWSYANICDNKHKTTSKLWIVIGQNCNEKSLFEYGCATWAIFIIWFWYGFYGSDIYIYIYI